MEAAILIMKKSLKIKKEQPESVNQRTDNTKKKDKEASTKHYTENSCYERDSVVSNQSDNQLYLYSIKISDLLARPYDIIHCYY